MAYSANDLKCRVELLRQEPRSNDLEETTYDYVPERSFWAEIVPTGGRQETIPGDMDRIDITHRITCRRSAVPKIKNGMRIRFRGQDYEVLYAYPNYKRTGWLDIYCRLVVEHGVRSF